MSRYFLASQGFQVFARIIVIAIMIIMISTILIIIIVVLIFITCMSMYFLASPGFQVFARCPNLPAAPHHLELGPGRTAARISCLEKEG